jgi:predicted amidophosphoribosyltransferase
MGERWFARNHAISMLSGRLHDAIKAYKYPPYRREWAYVFGRILLGYLDTHEGELGPIDTIIATPAYTGEGAHRDWDHVRRILEVAADHDWLGAWPIDVSDPPVIVRTSATQPLVGQTYRDRRRHAETVIRPLLRVADPSRTAGRRIAVVDDVFTDGLTLREVARALRQQGGAREVIGITLARKGWDRPDDAV